MVHDHNQSIQVHGAQPFRSDLDIQQLSSVTELEPYGAFASYDEIEVGKESEPVVWTITDDTIDIYCLMQDDFHEWYAIDSPFGGRVAPIMASSLIIRATFPYQVGGLFAGWEGKMHQVLRPNVPYVWQTRVADKWIKNDREWVAMEGTCHDPGGALMLTTKRVHILDFKKISEREGSSIVVPVPDVVAEVSDYEPMPISRRVADEWARDLSAAPVANVHYARADMRIGQDLVPVSCQYTWRKARDHAEFMYKYLFGWPDWMATHSFHVHPDAAAAYGLDRPNISGLNATGTLIPSMMLAALGQGWLEGGEFAYRVAKQMMLDDFLTAKGRLIEKRPEGANLRLVCDVWCENQRGERVVTGKASGVIAR